MRLLFVKLKHIGDSLLLTPTLSAVHEKYPKASIWVVVRKGSEGILSGCPMIDKILTAAAPESENRSRLNWWRDGQLIRELRGQHFDYAFELTDGDRGRWICYLSGAKLRCTNTLRSLNGWWRSKFNATSKFDWPKRHRVEKDFFTVNDCLSLGPDVPPLIFAQHRTAAWEGHGSFSNFAVIHPGTRWQRKRWPHEKWIAVGRHLLTRFERVIVSVGPDREEIALAKSISDALGPNAVSTEGRLSWAQVAGLLYRAKLFVGVDTVAMHLAAACQCPTVALFGPSAIEQWRPWKVAHRLVTPRQAVAEELSTRAIATEDVIKACQELSTALGERAKQTVSVQPL